MSTSETSSSSFSKILIANRGDQPQRGAAAKPKRMACEACAGDYTAKVTNV